MLVAPARTPPDIVNLLHREVRTITEDPEVRAAFVRLGLVPVVSPPPAELKAFVRSEIVRWGEIVKKAGLQGTE
jgi:tripartite-type tricarboxylate transporter receptor subunit TctC